MAKKLKLKFDLVDIMKRVTSSEQKLQVYLPLLRDPLFKREFGLRMIDVMEARMDEGIDKSGRDFVAYSNSYKKSELFQFFGKSSKVNLKLTGEMRAAIEVSNINPRSIELAFADQEQNDKAHGHVHGSNNLPVRDFWGIPVNEQTAVMKEMIREFSGRETVEIELPGVNADVGDQMIDLTAFEEDGE